MKFKPNLIKTKTTFSLLVILMGVFLLPKIAYFSTISEEKIIELTNQERNNLGLVSVTANQILTSAAIKKGQAIFESQTFKHDINGRKFSEWFRDAGYEFSNIGENLALDFVTSEGALKAWMESPSHKKNIVNGVYREIGIAVLEGNFEGRNTILIVQMFGTPLHSIAIQKIIPQNISNKINQTSPKIDSQNIYGQKNDDKFAIIASNKFSSDIIKNSFFTNIKLFKEIKNIFFNIGNNNYINLRINNESNKLVITFLTTLILILLSSLLDKRELFDKNNIN